MSPSPARGALVAPNVQATSVAAVWHGGDDIRLEELPVPSPARGELVVKISLTTIGGSDRRATGETGDEAFPHVIGQEGIGRVLAVGDDAPAAVGDRVVWGVTVRCGICDRCRAGHSAACRRIRRIGHEPLDGTWPLSGTAAQHILLPAGASIARVPATVTDPIAAPAGHATASVMAVLDAAGDLTGARVLVCGAGMLGLTAIAAARARGASEITVLEPDASRRPVARAFGATGVFAVGEPLVGVDVALEFSGAASAVETALAALTIGGRLILARADGPAARVNLDAEDIVRKSLVIIGVHDSEPRHLREAVAFLDATHATIPWERLIAPTMRLEHLPLLLAQPTLLAPRTAIAP